MIFRVFHPCDLRLSIGEVLYYATRWKLLAGRQGRVKSAGDGNINDNPNTQRKLLAHSQEIRFPHRNQRRKNLKLCSDLNNERDISISIIIIIIIIRLEHACMRSKVLTSWSAKCRVPQEPLEITFVVEPLTTELENILHHRFCAIDVRFKYKYKYK